MKLKTECGYQFTSKLESMFTDIKTSADTMRAYKTKRPGSNPATSGSSSSSDIDLSVQVCHCMRIFVLVKCFRSTPKSESVPLLVSMTQVCLLPCALVLEHCTS